MAEWTKVWEGPIGIRAVSLEMYDDGGYQVFTRQLEDSLGFTAQGDDPAVIMPPSAEGIPTSIYGENLQVLGKALVTTEDRFTPEEAEQIIGLFRQAGGRAEAALPSGATDQPPEP